MNSAARSAIGSVASAAVIVTIAAISWNYSTSRRLEAAKERIRQAGLPASAAELRGPAIADADNAAPLFAQIDERSRHDFRRRKEGEEPFDHRLMDFRLEHPVYRLSSEEVASLSALLGEPFAVEVLDLATRAAARPGYQTKRDPAGPPESAIPTVGPLRLAISALRERARLAVNQGRFEQACTDLEALFKIADFPRNEPTLISALLRIAVTQMALESLEQAVTHGAVTEQWNVRLADRINQLDVRRDYLRTIDSERVIMGTDTFEQMLAGLRKADDLFGVVDEPSGPMNLVRKLAPKAWLRREYAEYLDRVRLYRVALANASPAHSETIAALGAIASVSDEHPFVATVLPTVHTVTIKVLEAETRTAVVLAGLALHRFALKFGRLPQSLQEIAPDFLARVPMDNFNEQPLRYRLGPADAVVYSVGKNARDDGGVFAPNDDKDDLPWRIVVASPPAPPR